MSESKNSLQETADFLNSVPEVLDALSNLVQHDWLGWLVLIGGVVWVLLNKDVGFLFSVFERKAAKRLELLESYISQKEIACKELHRGMKDLRDAHYFKVATGIVAEKSRRNGLLSLHDSISHRINWKQIKRAEAYIEVSDDEQITVRKAKLTECFEYAFNWIVGLVFLLLSGILFIALVLGGTKTLGSLLFGIGAATSTAIFSMFVFSLNRSFSDAKSIRAALQEISSNKELNCEDNDEL